MSHKNSPPVKRRYSESCNADRKTNQIHTKFQVAENVSMNSSDCNSGQSFDTGPTASMKTQSTEACMSISNGDDNMRNNFDPAMIAANPLNIKSKSEEYIALYPNAVLKSPHDHLTYRALTLSNGLRTLLISDVGDRDNTVTSDDGGGSEKLSAVALCVGVGSFQDPDDLPGLAHFLEHMVFMGSKKYPDENAFDMFVKKHGGSNNAFTDCERTVFQCDIKKESFKEALDLFAQFFISPLLKRGAVDREVKAVDGEFEMNLSSDHQRKEQLLGSMCKKGHPMGKFMWGNIKTLKKIPEKKGINVYERLKNFHQKYYSAQLMTLVLQSRDSLEYLEMLARGIFSQIPNNGELGPDYSELESPFNPSKFLKLYKVLPVKNIHQLIVRWSLPSQKTLFKCKPLHFLGWLVGHEGKGSILSYLKKRLWAMALEGGNSDTGFEHNSACALFSVSVTLTVLGTEHIKEILSVIFAYIEMVRRSELEDIFDEIQTLTYNEFQWMDQVDTIEHVTSLAGNMQNYKPCYYITGEKLFFQYDYEAITAALNELMPEKCSIMIYSKNAISNDVEPSVEPWFETEYVVEGIPSNWKQIKQFKELHLPKPNQFIATNFQLLPSNPDSKKNPVVINETDKTKLWYKKDDKFKVPKAYVNFLLKTNFATSTAMNNTLFDVYVRVLEENLNEIAYDADAAQLSYGLYSTPQGLVIKVSGFNHKLQKLFATIITTIAQFNVNEKLFETLKEQIARIYSNHFIKPSRLAIDLRLTILEHPFWSSLEKRACVKHITLDSLREFAQRLTAQAYVEGLVMGNVTAEEAMEFEKILMTALKCDLLPKTSFPHQRVLQLPLDTRYCRVQSTNNVDVNSVILNYYQHGPGNLRHVVLNELLMHHMDEPCFDYLRTQKQLGYSVYCSHHETDGIIGFSITVDSQATKFSMEDLDKSIEDFLVLFGQSINRMSSSEFNKLKETLKTLKSCDDMSLEERVLRHWSEIVEETYVFDRYRKQVDILKGISLHEFQTWFKDHRPGGNHFRKLSTQVAGYHSTSQASGNTADSMEVEGSDDGEDDDDEIESDTDESMEGDTHSPQSKNQEPNKRHLVMSGVESLDELEFKPLDGALAMKSILDIHQFCNEQIFFPVSKIV